MKIYQYKGVGELYALPSCADMIDPAYVRGRQRELTKEEWDSYRRMRIHVNSFDHGPANFLFEVHRELSELTDMRRKRNK